MPELTPLELELFKQKQRETDTLTPGDPRDREIPIETPEYKLRQLLGSVGDPQNFVEIPSKLASTTFGTKGLRELRDLIKQPGNLRRVFRGVGEGVADIRVPRDGYITTYSSNPAVAASYAGPAGSIERATILANPTKVDEGFVNKLGMDKVGFDQHALKNQDRITLALQTWDPGPYNVGDRLHTYASDIYSTGPQNVISGHPTNPTEILKAFIKNFYAAKH